MLKVLRINMVLTIILLFSQVIPAQSDLSIFGFFQATGTHLDGGYSAVADLSAFGMPPMVVEEQKEKYLNANLQQLNLFVRKELNDNFTAWVNFELTNSYNTKNSWGSFSLDEAWVNYQQSDYFNVKAGLLIPRFGYLNEIKNRMPLLPYITRPLIYESSISVIDQTHYLPERAFVQVYGYIPINTVTLDYAAFVGPSEKNYILANGALIGSAADTTTFKLFGGRLGLKYDDLRIGFSSTFDKDNQQATLGEDVSRTRLAVDFGYSFFNFFVDGEYILVNLSSDSSSAEMNKSFYYGSLGYNFTDQLFGYATYSYIEDKANNILKAGMKGVVVGVGYRPTESVVIKAGYSSYFANSTFQTEQQPFPSPFNTTVDIDTKAIQLAISVIF